MYRSIRRRSVVAAAAVAAVAMLAATMGSGAAAVGAAEGPVASAPATRPPDAAALRLCVGLRGNGPKVFAHFGALAKLAETVGPIECAAGGSSGAISTFFIESTVANPLLHTCNGVPCTTEQVRQRQALLFRTMAGLTQVGLFDEINQLIALVNQINSLSIPGLLQLPILGFLGAGLLQSVLAQAGPLINPELGRFIANAPNPVLAALQTVKSLGGALSFRLDGPNSFLAPGPLNFAVLNDFVGRAGTFYAGYEPVNQRRMEQWMEACAAASYGFDFDRLSTLPGPGGRSCSADFVDQYNTFKAAAGARPTAPSRLSDPIGTYMPALVTTGILTGDAVSQWQAGRSQFLAQQPVTAFHPSFDDVRFGYFGAAPDLDKVAAGIGGFSDLGSQKFERLDGFTWATVLAASPAEPGLSAGVPLPGGTVSVGGWADPLRVQVLTALGARSTITINKQDGLGAFTVGIAAQLGATPEQLRDLFSIADPSSSVMQALSGATGVWCTNWDAVVPSTPAPLFADGYAAPLITSDPTLLGAVTPNASATTSTAGCTPGLTVTAPTASVTAAPTSGGAPLDVGFDASASDPGFGTVLQYRYDFGDGTSATSADAVTVHRYSAPGTYTATLRLTSSTGALATTTAADVTVGTQRADISLSGLGYAVGNTTFDGTIAGSPIGGALDAVNGTATYPGRNGGTASIAVTATFNPFLGAWFGEVRLRDAGAALSVTVPLFFASVSRSAGRIDVSQNGINFDRFPPVGYLLRLTLRS